MGYSPEQSVYKSFEPIPPDLKRMIEHVENNPEYNYESRFYKLAISKGLVRKGDKVYDLGCGYGYQLPFLSRSVGTSGKIFAVDIVPSSVANAQKESFFLDNIEALQKDARKINPPLNYNYADKVLLIEVMGMLPKQSSYQILNESILALKPKGKIIATMANKEFYLELGKLTGDAKFNSTDIEKDQVQYAPGLFNSLFTEKEIKDSLGKKCHLEIHGLTPRFLGPYNIVTTPTALLDKTKTFFTIATKK